MAGNIHTAHTFVYAFANTRRVTILHMPKIPMPSRVIRVPDKLWDAAKKRADERGETVSEAVRRFLERYVR